MPPAKVPPPVIAPRCTGLPRPVRSPVSDRPSEKAMLTPAPRAVAAPVKNAVSGRWVARATANMGARVDSDPSISPLSAGWTRMSRNDWVLAGFGEVRTVATASTGITFRWWARHSWLASRRAGCAGLLHRLVAAVHAELVVDVAHVRLYGVHRQVELFGDLGRGQLGGQVA